MKTLEQVRRVSSRNLFLLIKCLLHSFDCRQDVSDSDRYSGASLIRGAKDLGGWLQSSVATGANEHPCAVAPLGYIPVPELPACKQVLSISNAFAFISDRGEHHPRRLSNFAKTVLIRERKSFSIRDSLLCDSFMPLSRCLPVCPYLRLSPQAKGDAPCGKRNVPSVSRV